MFFENFHSADPDYDRHLTWRNLQCTNIVPEIQKSRQERPESLRVRRLHVHHDAARPIMTSITHRRETLTSTTLGFHYHKEGGSDLAQADNTLRKSSTDHPC